MNKQRIPDLVSDVEDELDLLRSLVDDLKATVESIPKNAKKRKIYEESIALKLHNFYTGCERIFLKIAEEINGGTGGSISWHKRLLRSMMLDIERVRPAVISKDTARVLGEYLAFRHLVRNIYGFEIDSERLRTLAEKLPHSLERLNKEVGCFLGFLRKLID